MSLGIHGLLAAIGAIKGAVDTNDDPGRPDYPSLRALAEVGAWVGQQTINAKPATMRSHVSQAAACGLNRLDVIINDHSKERLPRKFDTYDAVKIRALCAEAKDQGIDVHLMSWIMPHLGYLAEMGDTLELLVETCQATSVCLDAEEPWTKARRRLNYEHAANHVRKWSFPVGVTGIGYAPVPALEPLVKASSYAVPQCYATSSNKLDPATVVPRLVDRWRNKLGATAFVVGLPAYRQNQRAKGYGVEGAIRAAFSAARHEQNVSGVVYWSLRWIRQSKAVAEAIRIVTRELRSEIAT